MINDKDLQEAWYNLGRYQLSDASVSPSVGFCGSEYPLYLTGIIPFLFKPKRDDVKSISYWFFCYFVNNTFIGPLTKETCKRWYKDP